MFPPQLEVTERTTRTEKLHRRGSDVMVTFQREIADNEEPRGL